MQYPNQANATENNQREISDVENILFNNLITKLNEEIVDSVKILT